MVEEQKSGEIARLPIFPLPNVVFFPCTLLPLDIFEPRYKQMVSDALRANAESAWLCCDRVGKQIIMRMQRFTLSGLSGKSSISRG